MTEPDVVLQALAQLEPMTPPPALTRKLELLGHERIVPTKVHPLWSLAVAASVCVYLSWALLFTGLLS